MIAFAIRLHDCCKIKIPSPHATAKLEARHEAGASVPCFMLRQWVSLYAELLFRQEPKLQEHLHLNENPMVRWGFTACRYTTVLPSWGGGDGQREGLSSKGKLVTPEMVIL